MNLADIIDWDVAARPAPGESESGDGYVVTLRTDGVLIAGIDGVGHGDKAAAVRKKAVAVIEKYANETPSRIFDLCHMELRGTRGVVMSLAAITVKDNSMTWLGIGNVDGIMLKAAAFSTHNQAYNAYVSARTGSDNVREAILLRGGILGYQMPSLRPVTTKIAKGDLLIFTSDGIRSSYSQNIPTQGSPGQIAQDILSKHFRGRDDALVLVARYQGGASD